jgi:Deoxyribodipyrimidine photolyase
MARGRRPKPDGSEFTDDRGYLRIKVDGKWKMKHRHVAETEILHRELREGERVWFKNDDKTDCSPGNLMVKQHGTYPTTTPHRIRASLKVLRRKRDEIDEIIANLEAELDGAEPPRTRWPQSVYFIQAGGEGGLIKIGLSNAPAKRMKSLQSQNDLPLELLGVLPNAERSGEVGVHQMFADAREHGEWFRPVPELLEFLKEITDEPEPETLDQGV